MAILSTKKQSDLEKRLKLLHQQVYGKVETSQTIKSIGSSQSSSRQFASSDLTYLSSDLIKIISLSSMAIGIQVVFFILIKNHILNINFF